MTPGQRTSSRRDTAVARRTRRRGRPLSDAKLILWVRVRSPEQKALAQEILRTHGAKAVRVHEIEIEIEKRPEDLPLGTASPGPWLGSEPLGRP